MESQYEAFCLADPLFYDSLTGSGTARGDFPLAARPLPDGWRRHEAEEWLVFRPAELRVPPQGWKVHVSACLDNAECVLDAVWDYCTARDLEFKFLRSPRVMLIRNAKYADRGSSGKLVTIYPHDEAQLEQVLTELGEILDGEPGPYILSDLRWGGGPLYVRYGGFAQRFCLSDRGRLVPALADPTGTLVPDTRGPVFAVPPWVTLPAFLEPHLLARKANSTNDLPYQVERVLHFSNGGGLYVGHDRRTGEKVVLKEGRPHAGLDGTGTDAATRVRRERSMLERLAGIPGVPRVHDAFTLGDHEFLVLEFIDGKPLSRCQVERCPLIRTTADAETLAGYTEWALRVYGDVERTIEAINARGVVYGDLHMFNVLVRPDDTIALIDYEIASSLSERRRQTLGNQAFSAPRDRSGSDADKYSLACLRLALFVPLTALVRLDPAKARHIADIVADHYPVPRPFLTEAVDVIAPTPPGPPPPRAAVPRLAFEPDSDGWHQARRRLADAILASATPEREDRLFPGDVLQFWTGIGGLGLAYGAAGVLYALSVTGAAREPRYDEWLVKHALDPPAGTSIGCFDGMHGVAFVLDHLGYPEVAVDVLDMCLKEPWETFGLDLMGGLAGMGLNFLHFAHRTGEPRFLDAAMRAADIVADRLGDETAVPTTSGGGHPYAGLTHGSSGPALLFVRMYDETGDAGFLDRAATALGQDLRRCRLREDGPLEVDEGFRTMPYLARASAGIGLVLDEYLARRDDDQFATANVQIFDVVRSPLYAQSGLFAGRAGMIYYLARHRAFAPDHRTIDGPLRANIRRLGWHALAYRDGVAFPGEQLLRMSMDLGTGTAGVLLALGAAQHGGTVDLPLLAPKASHIPARPRGAPAAASAAPRPGAAQTNRTLGPGAAGRPTVHRPEEG